MRPSKDEYYLGIAAQVAARGTCLRRLFGAAIVKDDVIISTGYVGAPRGSVNCIDLGTCPREAANVKVGERYELCRSVHAEANAIINAARAGTSVLGGTLYLWAQDVATGKVFGTLPCRMCKRMIINAGIATVVFKTPDGVKRHAVADLITDAIDLTKPENVSGY